jgi:hypothetical protein
LSTGLKVHANQNESFILCSTDRQGKGEDPKRPIRPKDLFTTFLKDTAKTLPSSSSSSLLDKSGHNSTLRLSTPVQKTMKMIGISKDPKIPGKPQYGIGNTAVCFKGLTQE